MTEQPAIEIVSGLVILQPRPGNAYPVPCDEWKTIKAQVSKLTDQPRLYDNLASVFGGGLISILTTICVGTFSKPDQSEFRTIAWVVTVAMLFATCLSVWFSYAERSRRKEQAIDVLSQMELIERRFNQPT